MFLGTHTPKLDDKGRFFLPAKFRDALAEGLVIAKGQDRCLAIYTPAAFMKMAEQASRRPSTLREARSFQRVLSAGASQEVPDKQGRVTIPTGLRAYAGLDREIAVVGAFDRIEVWDLVAWEAYQAAEEENFAQMDGELAPGDGPNDRQEGFVR